LKIYVAGPYTKGDVALNVRNAIYAGSYIAHLGHIPFIPHLSHFWHMLIPEEYQFWMEQDEAWLRECDAILRLPGESKGADQEMKIAEELGFMIYKSIFDIPKVLP
jgi:hypothetical protein